MVVAGGGQLTRRQHLLSQDGRSLLVCTGNSIRVYSASTSELLFVLEGHADEVTGLCLHPKNSTEVYSCSKDGTVSQWDLNSGTRIQFWSVIGEPIESITIVDTTAFLTCSWREAQAGRALAFDLFKGSPRESRVKLSKPRRIVASTSGNIVATHDRFTVLVWPTSGSPTTRPMALHHTKAITCVAISPDGSRVAAGDVTGRIAIWHDVASRIQDGIASEKQEEQHIDEAIIQDDFQWQQPIESTEPPAATVHWHAHPVGCLTFSIDGHYLLSGGQEAVLVIWDTTSGRRAYLPRLGGPLVGIAPCREDAAKYAIRQFDNTLRVINVATMTVEASLHGLRPLPSALKSFRGDTLVAIQPITGLAVVPGPHAVLQWYDLTRDLHVDKLQVTNRNVVSLTEQDAAAMNGIYGAPAEPAAVMLAFNHSGEVLATVETKPDPVGGGVMQYALKFWDKVPVGEARYGQPYKVNTIADQPHRSSSVPFGTISSLSFHPTTNLAATTSNVGEFKLWSRHTLSSAASSAATAVSKTKRPNDSTWRCVAVAGHREQHLTASAFSSDGSVLAIGSITGTISLWDANQVSLVGVLPPPPFRSHPTCTSVQQLMFVSGSPILVASIESAGIAVYNVLTMRCEWAVEQQHVGAVAVDPNSSHWAVHLVTSGGRSKQRNHKEGSADYNSAIVVFRGTEEEPVAAWKIANTGGSDLDGTALAFAPHGTPLHSKYAGLSIAGASPLIVLNERREYEVAMRQNVKGEADLMRGATALAASGLGRRDTFASGFHGPTPSAFEAIYGRSAKVDDLLRQGAEGGESLVGRGNSTSRWAALLDAPSHALPAMSVLCPAFLESMILGGDDD